MALCNDDRARSGGWARGIVPNWRGAGNLHAGIELFYHSVFPNDPLSTL